MEASELALLGTESLAALMEPKGLLWVLDDAGRLHSSRALT